MLHVVWFKRDFRITDHRPLVAALTNHEPILPLFVAEPSIWQESELSIRHFQFVMESLADLQKSFREKGGALFVTIGEMESVLETIYDTFGPFTLHAHEENGTPLTFDRDKRVRQWMKEHGIPFHEYQQYGVVRGPFSRDTFKKDWKAFMEQPLLEAPESIVTIEGERLPSTYSTTIESLSRFNVNGERIKYGQQGGESLAQETLENFLTDRFKRYNEGISKPLASTTTCSRLSPYIAWGNISMRQVVQETRATMDQCDSKEAYKHLKAFYSRLQWHCHFIQRIEDDPDISRVSIHPNFDRVREEWDEGFERWCQGQTGIPMVDAAMRALHKTGWINFRSRAMLVSFASHTLMLDWRKPADYLAQLFLDYEPGIHYSQVQMQATTTGSNTIRIYNPIKQGKDHDSEGRFVRQYVPELKHVPDAYIHEPWKYDGFFHLKYAPALVDVSKANRRARDILWSVKEEVDTQDVAKEQLEKHGSRTLKRRSHKQKANDGTEQLSFDLFQE